MEGTEIPAGTTRVEASLPGSPGTRVVVVGAGFGGLAFARSLKSPQVQVVVIDRNNYHTFPPLLYQVATAGLEPDSIAYPVRRVFRKRKNVVFRMAEFQSVDPDEKVIQTSIGAIPYDYLVIATGSTSNFYNLAPVAERMMPLKSVADALNLRSFIMQNLERATTEADLAKRTALMNVAIVGAGPTGVELAGALSEMRRHVLPKDFKELDLKSMQIYLFETADRPLPFMSAVSSTRAARYLRKLRVRFNPNAQVTGFDGSTLTIADGRTIAAETLVWTAGVKPTGVSGLASSSYLESGRLRVDRFLNVKDAPNVSAIGDNAAIVEGSAVAGHPMLAPVAIQQGRLVARNIVAELKGKKLRPFSYHDRGVMATVGRNKAVADLKLGRFGGTIAWFMWMFIHIWMLIGFRNKLVTFVGWAYNYFTYDRALGLIIRPYKRK